MITVVDGLFKPNQDNDELILIKINYIKGDGRKDQNTMEEKKCYY